MVYLFNNEIVEALTQLFPNCFSNGEIKKINDSYLYTYRNNNFEAEGLLINVPISKMDKMKLQLICRVQWGKIHTIQKHNCIVCLML